MVKKTEISYNIIQFGLKMCNLALAKKTEFRFKKFQNEKSNWCCVHEIEGIRVGAIWACYLSYSFFLGHLGHWPTVC